VNPRSRRAVLTGTVLTVLLTAGPALAEDRNPLGRTEGANPGDGISPLETIGLYVLIPLAIMLVVGGLAYATGGSRASRYRPTRGWDAAPVWFAGPPNPGEAVASASVGDVTRGGASGSW
jgi:hypothetical protein